MQQFFATLFPQREQYCLRFYNVFKRHFKGIPFATPQLNYIMRYLILLIGTVFLSCSNSSNTANQNADASNENTQQTSTALANLPAKYTGYIGCDNCDSLWVELTVNTDQKYLLSKKYIGQTTEMKDSASNSTGDWMIDGDNVMNLEAEQGSPEFSKLKIMTPAILQVLDSTGSVMTNGKNYLLKRDESTM